MKRRQQSSATGARSTAKRGVGLSIAVLLGLCFAVSPSAAYSAPNTGYDALGAAGVPIPAWYQGYRGNASLEFICGGTSNTSDYRAHDFFISDDCVSNSNTAECYATAGYSTGGPTTSDADYFTTPTGTYTATTGFKCDGLWDLSAGGGHPCFEAAEAFYRTTSGTWKDYEPMTTTPIGNVFGCGFKAAETAKKKCKKHKKGKRSAESAKKKKCKKKKKKR
jgi:hypothetical protein